MRNKIYPGGFADIGYAIIKERQNRILELQQQLKDLLFLPVNLKTRIRKERIEKELSKLKKEDQDENTNK